MDEERAKETVDDKVDDAEALLDRHGRTFRIMWVAVGVIVIGAGIAMTVFPGPVTIVIPAGLIMLAAVFGWARTLLLSTVEKGVEAKEAFAHASRWVRILGYVASACVAAAVAAFFLL